MKINSEPPLFYYTPGFLCQMADQSDFPFTWAEMIQDIDLGTDEFKVLLRLGEKCDLGIEEILLLYLRYWENLDGQEIANRYGVDKSTISRHLTIAKEKLHPELLATISSIGKE